MRRAGTLCHRRLPKPILLRDARGEESLFPGKATSQLHPASCPAHLSSMFSLFHTPLVTDDMRRLSDGAASLSHEQIFVSALCFFQGSIASGVRSHARERTWLSGRRRASRNIFIKQTVVNDARCCHLHYRVSNYDTTRRAP